MSIAVEVDVVWMLMMTDSERCSWYGMIAGGMPKDRHDERTEWRKNGCMAGKSCHTRISNTASVKGPQGQT